MIKHYYHALKLLIISCLLFTVITVVFGTDIEFAEITQIIPPYLTVSKNMKPIDTMPVIDMPHASMQSYKQGYEDCSGLHDPLGFFLVGLSGGTVFGLLGAVGAYNLASKNNPISIQVPEGCLDADYRKGYTERSISNNRRGSIIGGALGTAIHVTILINILSDSIPSIHLNIP